MLDSRTLEWLKNREETLLELGSFFCPWCEHYKEEWDSWTGHCQKVHCRKLEEGNFSRRLLFDALQFEARLNELLVEGEEIDLPCSHLPKPFACPYTEKRDTPCSWCNLKELRLLVEAEMEEK